MKYVTNAFSLQMLREPDADIRTRGITKEMFDALVTDAYSVIGHEDIANITGLPFNRESITLVPGDILLVAQVVGGRLPEGTTKLPEGKRMEYRCVEIKKPEEA